METNWEYSGRELESMSLAVKYHRWILDLFHPYMGRRIVEVGAGTGALSELLLQTKPEYLAALEPSANMFPHLSQNLRRADTANVATAHQSTLESLPPLSKPPDTIVYINVLEHIEHDEKELRTAASLLQPKGKILIFVPANRWLMSNMDRHFGHFRRYSMPELISKCEAAGLRILFSRHFDALGILPWMIKFRLMGSEKMEPGAVRLYDNVVVPFARVLEGVISPPLGKNIILAAEKSS